MESMIHTFLYKVFVTGTFRYTDAVVYYTGNIVVLKHRYTMYVLRLLYIKNTRLTQTKAQLQNKFLLTLHTCCAFFFFFFSFFFIFSFFAGGCPSGWLSSSGFCYYVDNTAKSYTDAEQSCLERGATLASMTHTDELNFVTGRPYTIILNRYPLKYLVRFSSINLITPLGTENTT